VGGTASDFDGSDDERFHMTFVCGWDHHREIPGCFIRRRTERMCVSQCVTSVLDSVCEAIDQRNPLRLADLTPEGGICGGLGKRLLRELNAFLPRTQAQPTGRLVVITIAPPVRIFPLLRFGALVQIPMLSMSLVFPLIVVDSFLSTATRHHDGRSDRHCEQKWSEVPKQ